MPVEYGAMLREMFLAYRLLEDYGRLKVTHRLLGPPRLRIVHSA